MTDMSWCCGCGVHGEGLEGLIKHVKDNPNVNHREHCDKIHSTSLTDGENNV